MSDTGGVLIVDDIQDNLSILRQIILDSLPGYDVFAAQSAEEGLLLATRTDIDVALVDVQMPGMNGLELCRHLKSDERTRLVPVILVTSHRSTPELRVEGLVAGADDFVSRPIDNIELVARIKVMLRIKRAEDELREINVHLEETVAERTRELRESEERFRSIIECLPMGIHMYRLGEDGQLRFIGANPAADKILGVDNTQYVGRTICEAFPEISATDIPERFRAIAEEGGFWHNEDIIYEDARLSGAFENFNFRTSPDEMASLFIDITERKKVEQEVGRRAALGHVRAAVYQMREVEDMDNVLTSLFEALRDLGVAFDAFSVQIVRQDEPNTAYGITRDGIQPVKEAEAVDDPDVPSAVYTAFHDQRPVYRRDLDKQDPYAERTMIRAASGTPVRSVLDMPFSHGTIAINSLQPDAFSKMDIETLRQFAEVLSEAYIRYEDMQRVEEASKALKAYSERLEEMVEERTRELQDAQEQLMRRERMAVLGQLAGGVGHELRNPLGAIKNASYFLNMVIEEPEPEMQSALEILAQEVENSEKIISSLLDFARGKPPVRRKQDIDDLVRATLSRVNVPENVEVVCHLDEEVPVIFADPDQLDRVFGNIVQNAIQAMSDGGRLTVKTEATCGNEPSGRSQGVSVSFTDTGPGIPEENRDKLFEPLFTTKARGIGLGLALTRTLVEGHGGTIEVESEVEKGSTFTVWLPVSGRR